jgi:prenyltransferase beta subunit
MSAGRVHDVHAAPGQEHESTFHKAKHVKYWLRCLKTYLPNAYTGNDSNRMMLAFFTLAAMDLLGSLEAHTTPAERDGYADWIYLCQHPDGGFRGFPGTDFGERSDEKNKVWDPANVAGTYFAFSMLAILKDDFSRVKRRECLQWLCKMQRPDGSFGETLGEGGRVEGGMDPRFGYMALGIRWFLRGKVRGEVMGVPDVDVDKLVYCIRQAQVGTCIPLDGSIAKLKIQRHTTAAYQRHLFTKRMVCSPSVLHASERRVTRRQEALPTAPSVPSPSLTSSQNQGRAHLLA